MNMTCEDWLRQENERLQADLAAAQRELAAWEQATHEGIDGKWLAEDIWPRLGY
jgi:hypothetical protein